MLRAGERIGDWVVDEVLGEGGMGAVYRAHSALSGRLEAALKVMKPSLEPDARARFVREAEALSALRHPAVVRIMGFSEDTARGLLYLAMELAEGETLKSRLERGPLSLGEALAVFVALASALDHAHAAGIYHRDIKPSNIVLCHDGTIRLVDFGIAAARQADTLTRAGQMGTVPYLAPEVFRGEAVDPPRLDVYAFGLVLHEALTGLRVFPVDPQLTPAAAAAAVGVKKLQQEAIDVGEGFPDRLRAVLRRATDPDPARRPSIHEMRLALESLVERRGVSGRAAEPTPSRPIVWTPPSVMEQTMRVPDPPGPAYADAPVYAGTPGQPDAYPGAAVYPGARRRKGPHTAPVHVRRRRRLWWAVATVILAAVLGVGVGVFLGGGLRTNAAAETDGMSAATSASDTQATRPGTPRRRTTSPSPSSLLPGAAVAASPSPSPRPLPSGLPSALPSPQPSVFPSVHPSPSPSPKVSPSPSPQPTPSPPLVVQARTPAALPVQRPAPETAADSDEDNGEAPDLSGVWDFSTRIESTDYAPYQGMRFGYRLALQQDGSQVTGQGQKLSENGTPLPPGQRTRILVSGTIEGSTLALTFVEHGATRSTRGVFRLRISSDFKGLAGGFSSEAANTEGGSTAHRVR